MLFGMPTTQGGGYIRLFSNTSSTATAVPLLPLEKAYNAYVEVVIEEQRRIAPLISL